MAIAAAFTIVQNETVFLQRWLDHTVAELGPENVFVLDHDSSGDAADVLADACQQADVKVFEVTHEHSYDSIWLADVTRAFQKFLLSSYPVVVFSAADEIVLPDENAYSGGLRSYVESFMLQDKWAGVRASGFEVCHKRDEEQPLDFAQTPWLEARKYWYPCQAYSKPVVSKVPLYWLDAWRRASNIPTQHIDPELRLVHLHRIDYDHCLESHREKNARTWKPEERQMSSFFRHNTLEDPEMLGRWILCNSDDTATYAELSEIPPEVRGAI